LWSRVGLVPLAGGAALAFGALLASGILVPMGRPGGRAPVIGPLALGAGWLAAAIGSLTYYIGVGLVAALAAMLAIVALACALSAARPDMGPRRAAGALAALVITLPALAIASAPGPRYVGAAGQLRVMTYNVHLGYDDGDIPAIDVIGDEIAREAPDVVGLEEVSRGTVISGGHDMLQLLAERTHMSFAFAPMLGDVEGVGVLSRFPIDEVRVVPLARSTRAKDLTRVLLLVRTGGLWFGATHLGGDDFTTQTRSIADAVHGLDRFVVSGDMNSTPETSQMRVLADAGLTDLGAAANAPTFPVADPVDRIDYLWVAGVTGTNVATPRTSASDHLPVIATVAVR
ncbi:MAG TPA: endonuclease/exonuclease/phosphatase family protein, partial [Candidatus Limnocylindria bacterium]